MFHHNPRSKSIVLKRQPCTASLPQNLPSATRVPSTTGLLSSTGSNQASSRDTWTSSTNAIKLGVGGSLKACSVMETPQVISVDEMHYGGGGVNWLHSIWVILKNLSRDKWTHTMVCTAFSALMSRGKFSFYQKAQFTFLMECSPQSCKYHFELVSSTQL